MWESFDKCVHGFIGPDPVGEANRHFADEYDGLKDLPVCANCGEPIQQESAVKIGDKWYCDACLDDAREWIA